LPRPQLCAVINAEDDDGFIISGFDSMHDDVGQGRHDNLACSRKRAFVSYVWKCGEQLGRLANARADPPRCFWIAL
jgi:hypothetical protein